MIEAIFQLTADILLWVSAVTGLTYEGVNVLIWFVLIPIVFASLVDAIYDTWLFTVMSVIWSFLVVGGPYPFSETADDLFGLAASFLRWFENIGMSYEAASVAFCLILPAVVFGVLVRKLITKLRCSKR